MSEDDITLLKKRISDMEKDRKYQYMDNVKVGIYIASAERAVKRLHQAYRILTEVDKEKMKKAAPPEKIAAFVDLCDKVSAARIHEEAQKVEYVTQLRNTSAKDDKPKE